MGHRQSRIEHWGAVMARFGESGQEPAAFCRECGIGIQAFRCWRREPGLAPSPGEGALELVPLREDPPGEAAGGPAPDGWRDSGVRVEAGGLRIAPGVGLDPASPVLAIRVAGGGTCRVSPEPCRSAAARPR